MVGNKLLVDLAYEYCTPDELADLTVAVKQRLVGLRNVYKITGNWYGVQHTPKRVGSHNPPCGGNEPYDPDMVRAGQNVMAMAVLFMEVPVAAAITFAIGFVTAFFGSQVQKNSNCVPVLGLIPAVIDEQWFRDHVTVRYFVDDDWGNREVSPGDAQWARFEQAIFPSEPYVDIPVTPSPIHDGKICRMTTISALFKNWSHTKSRRVRIDLYMDALPHGEDQCVDYSIINRDLYEDEIVRCIPVETKQRLIREYADELDEMIRS